MRWLVLFFCLSAAAQPFNAVTSLPFLARNQVSPANPGNITNRIGYWWVSSDLTTNTPVTNWVDRIQGFVWGQGNVATQPTNSALGVGFGGSQSMTNTGGHGSPGASFFWIYEATVSSANAYLIGSPGGGGYGFVLNSLAWTQPGFPHSDLSSATIPTGKLEDVEWDGSNFFTNGVLSVNVTMAGFDLTTLGSVNGSIDFWKGYITEIGWWTNTVFDSVTVSNLHHYATNTYHFSP